MTELPHSPIATHDPVQCHACAVLLLRDTERVTRHQASQIKALEARLNSKRGIHG